MKEGREVRIALVTGDGAAPEMMAAACAVAIEAAKKDGIEIVFEKTPMGWNAFREFGDTLPAESLKRAVEIGTLFFGGVGDTEIDKTLGVKHPEMMPEARALLALRKEMGLLLNFRPVVYHKSLDHLCLVRPENIPSDGIVQVFVRMLLEDSYFGTSDLYDHIGCGVRDQLMIKLKKEVVGDEEAVVELAYYRRETLLKYMRAVFWYARERGLPVISIDKTNVMARYVLWRKMATEIGKAEFPDVPLSHLYVDAANALLGMPMKLAGVIMCGNEHGDILSDGAAGMLGSLGMMCSSAVNPETGSAMFESGAGTACDLKGKDKVNPIGRILTAAMMLRHIGAKVGAGAIEKAVEKTLLAGYRTADLARLVDNRDMILGTEAMGEAIMTNL
ncbi:MAG: hypothetical protein HGB18_01935 [Candidatus Moranbacteria bacterium]|nr:hypothetical protein [Candidatus Moranbacteria bacterium]